MRGNVIHSFSSSVSVLVGGSGDSLVAGDSSSAHGVVIVEHGRGNELLSKQLCFAQEGMEPNGTRSKSAIPRPVQ